MRISFFYLGLKASIKNLVIIFLFFHWNKWLERNEDEELWKRMIISLFECEKHHYISESFIYLLLCAIATEEPQQSHINIKHPSFSLLSSLSRTLCLFLSHPFLFYLKLCFRSMLAEPVFTYNYGYSFAVLILSFLLSELTGTFYFSKMVSFSF